MKSKLTPFLLGIDEIKVEDLNGNPSHLKRRIEINKICIIWLI